MKMNIQDVTASVVAVILVTGAVMAALTDHAFPAELSTAMGACMTWLFVRAGYAMTKPPLEKE